MSFEPQIVRGERMRVIHVTTAHSADDVRIFQRECKSLAASGLYDVTLAAPGELSAFLGVAHYRLKPPAAGRLSRFLAGHRVARRLVKSSEFDLWHIHDPELIPTFVQLAREGKNVVWDAHEDYEAQFVSGGAKAWVPPPFRGLARVGTRKLLARIDQVASGVVASTPQVAKRYQNQRTVIVGNEAQVEIFSSCSPRFDSRRLLFTGNPGSSHLFPEIVKALVGLPDVTVAVAGKPPNPKDWRRFKRQLGDRLTHLGWLDRHELAAEMTQSAAGLLTYANTEAYEVASPTKGFEFAAAGLPAIASPNGMNVSLLERSHGGFVARGFSWQAIQDAIREALSDHVAWTEASKSARMWACSEGSWSESEMRLLDLYRSIFQERTK